ncbi:hypothetical protein Nepgr_001907 [Nepenthes gracilis]|uniref:Uncharacterized protein n=1 Tax=Nepenthes gracilis TaxID=150966 RepID=A0AAD3P809_NEPGR|nr:hypothetical protein Nepgr_001907 [Nepenthes gracilis]
MLPAEQLTTPASEPGQPHPFPTTTAPVRRVLHRSPPTFAVSRHNLLPGESPDPDPASSVELPPIRVRSELDPTQTWLLAVMVAVFVAELDEILQFSGQSVRVSVVTLSSKVSSFSLF